MRLFISTILHGVPSLAWPGRLSQFPAGGKDKGRGTTAASISDLSWQQESIRREGFVLYCENLSVVEGRPGVPVMQVTRLPARSSVYQVPWEADWERRGRDILGENYPGKTYTSVSFLKWNVK